MDNQEKQATSAAWVITRVFTATGVPVEVKASGATTSAAIDDLYAGIAHGIEIYHWQTEAPKAAAAPPPVSENKSAPPPVSDKAAQIAAEEGNAELAAELAQQSADVPPPPDGGEWRIFDTCFVKILPQPNGRTTIEFYSDDRKTPHNDFPGVKVTNWKVEQADALMEYVTSASTEKAAEYTIHCRVYYTEGKEYQKQDGTKGRYKDVAHVRPLGGFLSGKE